MRVCEMIGRHLGAYRLTDYINRGESAAVFLGERIDGCDSDRKAAVKVMRHFRSEIAQHSCQREREVLASLDHPGIVRLIEGGFTDAGTPFLITEYIEGISMREYAALHSLGADQRLKLLLAVCRVVGVVHQQHIVHRDIKPSNILVTGDGGVKLLDFGAAKRLISKHARHSGRSFTPAYAAPEQFAAGRASLASDVYGLGVVLQELLIGVNSVRITPCAPSTLLDLRMRTDEDKRLKAMLRGGLDRIILTALATEPHLRYPTADALADDIALFSQREALRSQPSSIHFFGQRIRRLWRGKVAAPRKRIKL